MPETTPQPFVPFTNTAEVRVQHTMNGKPVENTLYFQRADSIQDTELQELAAAIESWWNTYQRPSQAGELTHVRTVAVELSTPDSLMSIADEHEGASGGGGNDVASNQSALCVRFGTNKRGRSWHGRNYVPGVPEAVVNESRVSPEFIAAMMDAYEQLQFGGVPEGWTWVVASRRHNKEWRTLGVTEPVTGVSITTTALASVRSRRPKG